MREGREKGRQEEEKDVCEDGERGEVKGRQEGERMNATNMLHPL